MENKENIEMTNNAKKSSTAINDIVVPEPLKKDLAQAAEMYDIIKTNLIEMDREWLKIEGNHSLLIDFKIDLMYLITFLAVMSGSADDYPIYIAEKIFTSDPESNYAMGFLQLADNLGIRNLIKNYQVTEDETRKFDEFTRETTSILKILPAMEGRFKLSMIYYLYSALLASICKLLEPNAFSPIIYTGINNYLCTQFKVCEAHMEQREQDEFDNNVFPFLKRINDKIAEAEQAAKEFYGITDDDNKE